MEQGYNITFFPATSSTPQLDSDGRDDRDVERRIKNKDGNYFFPIHSFFESFYSHIKKWKLYHSPAVIQCN